MKPPVLYIFSGLPGSGKSTLSQRLATRLGCTYLRIDTIEQSLVDLCSINVEAEGYEMAFRLAADNLNIQGSVIADSCNPVEISRGAWENLARSCGADFVNIEVFCSDAAEHQRRVETRVSSIAGHRLPTWHEVQHREYEPWTRERIAIDTFGKTVEESLEELWNCLLDSKT